MSNYYYITPEDFTKAENNGICKDTLLSRVYRLGWSIDKAVNTPVLKRKITKEEFLIGEQNGINRKLVSSRVCKQGWSVEKAINTPVRKAKARKYPNWVYDKCKENGIDVKLFLNRINAYKWDIDKACSTPPLSQKEVLAKMKIGYYNRKKHFY